MMDKDKNLPDNQKKTTIDFKNEMDRDYWTALWGINDRQLKEALEASGSNNADEIERILRYKKYI